MIYIMKKKRQNNKSIKLNYIYNVSYQILTMITPLITTPYLSRILRADGIGLYSFTASLVTYFIMFAAMGTVNYGNREISYLQHNKVKRSTVFWDIETLSFISSIICLAAYIVFIFIYHKYVDILLVQLVCIINVAADITWLFQGMEEFGKVTARNVLFRIINIAFIFIFIRSRNDLLLYIIGVYGIELLSNISLWFYLPQYVNAPRLNQLHPLKHLKPTFLLFIPTIATTIYTAMDKTMLTQLTCSTAENGYYDQATKISRMTLMVVTALGTVMIPRIGNYFSEHKYNEIRELLYKSFRFVWFIGLPLCFGLIGISRNFSPWFYGDGYEKVPYLLMILAFLIPIIGISNVIGIQYFLTTKQEKYLTRSVCCGAVCNFILNLILIPHYMSYGAAIASVLSELLITILQMWYARKELSPVKIISLMPKYLVSGIIMLIILLILDYLMPIGVLYTFSMIAVGFIVYIFMLWLLHDELIIDIVDKIKTRFNH